jgi:MFS-type transporter involved in bile tolerance (Atg22 family)
MISPIVKFNVAEETVTGMVSEHTFFRLIHISLMVISILVITIGSARAKRAEMDRLKFKILLIWFSIALLIILMAIPWPFSPLANRPYFRSF